MKLSAKRREIEFEWEFADGETAKFTYVAPSSKQIDDGATLTEVHDLLAYSKKVLSENISGDKKLIKKMFKELDENGNIYEFKEELDIALGKLKKKR